MSQLTIQQAFELALRHHQAGQWQQAEQLYRQILAQQPGHADVLHFLGLLVHQVGQHEMAVGFIRQALALKPRNSEAYSNLGLVLKAQGQLDEAIAAYREALALKPHNLQAYSNLGIALKDKGQLDEAILAYRQALALNPTFAEVHNNLGNALREKGLFDDALAAYQQAVALKPNYPEAYNNLGTALRDLKQNDGAIAAFRQAIALRPDFPDAHFNLGIALRDQAQRAEAMAAYRLAITFNSGHAEAHYNLGVALRDNGQMDEAVAAFQQAVALKSDYPEALNSLGVALGDMGQLDEAVAALRQASVLNANNPDAHSNLLVTLNYHPASTAGSLCQEARHWAVQFAEPLQRYIPSHANDRSPERRLRIGYLSADFWEHASAFFLMPLLTGHDHQNVEIFCYAHVTHPDYMTRRMQALADHWRNIAGLDDEAAAAMIQSDQIDILIDLKLHTAHNRLLIFARKPAPVQATWLGYPGTTGLSAIDYRLSDPYLDPPGIDESVYSEKTIRLPDCFWCYDPLFACDIPCNALPALANGYVTFGCLNNFCKVNEAVLRLWAKVLRAVPVSRLLLLAPVVAARPHVLKVLEEEGIAPQRIEFAPHQHRRPYLQTYQRIDLGLDTSPYNGHTTTQDSFWMGVPVVTLVGQTAVGRAGLSLLSHVGLPELAANSAEEYVRIASKLAGDLPRLSHLRATVRQRMQQSPLMDGARFARNIEAAYRHMWRRWCARPAGVL